MNTARNNLPLFTQWEFVVMDRMSDARQSFGTANLAQKAVQAARIGAGMGPHDSSRFYVEPLSFLRA